MNEELSIGTPPTKKEKIKIFLLENKKKIIFLISSFILLLIGYMVFKEFQKKQKLEISNMYNKAIIQYSKDSKIQTMDVLVKIINKKDPTYSPLSLYFIIENKIILEKKKINELFDILIKKTQLDKEIKNLIVYKKALFNSDEINENELLDILNPIINSESVWKSHSLYLIAEYFYYKDEMQKSKEFYDKIVSLDNANRYLQKKAQKRLNRDLSD